VDIAIVVAVALNQVIGRDGELPWHLPDDLRHFRALTLGKPILMGRRTFESIGRALPGRRNLVLSSRSPGSIVPPDVEYVKSLDQAQGVCAGLPELCVIGGAMLYVAALPRTTRIHLTQVHANLGGDVHFPLLDMSEWQETARVEHSADERHAFAMSFITLERVARAAGTVG
jgi:dihydrofolate reductase